MLRTPGVLVLLAACSADSNDEASAPTTPTTIPTNGATDAPTGPGDDTGDTDSIAGCPACTCELTDLATPGRPFAELTFHNFDPAVPFAILGLADVWEGAGFRNGIPQDSMDLAADIGGVLEDLTDPDNYPTDAPEGHFTVYGNLPSPPNRPPTPEWMPLGRSYFTRDGFDLQNGNCFACHAGVASGIVVAGLANTHLDQTSGLASAEALLKIDDTLKTDAKLTQSDEAEEELKAYLENIDMTVRATFKFAEARGDNLGPYAVWRRLSRLTDPVGLGLVFYGPDDDAPLDPLFEAQHLTTVDPLPWWLRKYRGVQYWFSETTPGVAAHFAFNFTVPHNNTNDHHEEHVAAIDRILTFAQHTTSPAFPAQLNPANVQYGAALYHGETALADGSTLGCADCHGNYKKIGDDWATPGDWSVDYQDGELLDVGTDMAYSQILLAFPPIAEHGNGLTQYFNNLGKPNIAPQTNIPLKAGYLAPPLVGIWASAPYFHNGSVPTLRQVLDSTTRAPLWQRDNTDPFAYDYDETGLAHTRVDMTAAQYDALGDLLSDLDPLDRQRVDHRAIYPTHHTGKSNAGHTFGDAMNEAERCAMIDFLRSLSGENMPPA